MVSLQAIELVSAILESMLYGFSIMLLLITLSCLFRERKTREFPIVILLAVLSLAVLSTLHVVLDHHHSYTSFVTGNGEAERFLDNKRYTFSNIVYFLETILADSIVIYRCYVVWQNFWLAIPPLITCAGASVIYQQLLVASLSGIFSRADYWANPEEAFAPATENWVISFYSLALATNVLATCILAVKLWMVNRDLARCLKGCQRSNIYPLVLVILECGALYSISLSTMLIVYVVRSRASYLVINIVSQIIPITFYFILLRAYVARTDRDNHRCESIFSQLVDSLAGPHETRLRQLERGSHDDLTTIPETLEVKVNSAVEAV
ncbi:hypothetical protein BDZ89DRAFT_1062987 [Hymenopellis radicata]|nr:hypothetical protein BDZ89DRAFT_1062987 [Hymenopellis radicata]